jgi:hypothetical protein
MSIPPPQAASGRVINRNPEKITVKNAEINFRLKNSRFKIILKKYKLKLNYSIGFLFIYITKQNS